jgi:Na+-transporting NADH:ubiquinone oxidoreductase subunit D
VAVIRELLGFGTLLGYRIMPVSFLPWTIMVMAPSAFFILAIIIWIGKSIQFRQAKGASA